MSCDVEVHDASSIVCEDNKNEEDFEPNGVDGEEVDGGELRNVILEERPPRLRWGFRTSDHVFGNGSFGYLNVQLHQLAVDAVCAPNWVLAAHDSNRGFVSELEAVQPFRPEPSKSNTDEILDDASR